MENFATGISDLVLCWDAWWSEQPELSDDHGLQLWARDVLISKATFTWCPFQYICTAVRVVLQLLLLQLWLLLLQLLLHNAQQHIARKHPT